MLPPHTATMDDCCRLAEMLFGATTDSLALTIGFLEIISPVKLSVTAVYAATDADSNAVSIDVEQIDAKKVAVPRLTTVSGALPHTDEVWFNENGGRAAAVFIRAGRTRLDSAYTSGVKMIPSPAALVIAHPGHELRLHHWLETARPRVFVITDGSGSGRSRIHSTIEVLEATGCTAGTIMAALTDREIYRMLLRGDVDPVFAMTLNLADSLIDDGIRAVVADACEWYNPTHDLCSVMARLAAERAGLTTGRRIACYEYAVTEAASSRGETLELDDAALSRKTAAAHRYEALSLEVENLIARIGDDALRREVLRPIATDLELLQPRSKPFYETHGESRVAAGQYDTVIRYEQHFRPFVATLIAAVRNAAPAARD